MKRMIGAIAGILAIAGAAMVHGLTGTDGDGGEATAAAEVDTVTAASVSTGAAPEAGELGESTSTSEAATSETSTAGAAVDGTTYATDTATITVAEVTIGTGSDQVTYYAADVQLADGATLQTALADGGRDDTSDIAADVGAVLAINADYFAARDDGIIIRDGVVFRDVPARTGLAIYADGRVELYDETQTSADALVADGVTDTLSFGPALLANGELGTNLDTVEVEANPRHPIQGSQPRAGIGIVEPGHFVFVVVDGRSPGYSRGVTLTEFAEIFADLGCTAAYNLDGGGSATLVFQGEVVNIPLGRGTERAVGDILYVA